MIHAHASRRRRAAGPGAPEVGGEALDCDLRDAAATDGRRCEPVLEAGVPQIVVHNAGTHDDVPHGRHERASSGAA